MRLLAHQFDLLKQVEFDWDQKKITPEEIAVKLAIYKEQNKVVFKMADFYLTAGKTGDSKRLKQGIHKFVGSKRPMLEPPEKMYDRTAERGHE